MPARAGRPGSARGDGRGPSAHDITLPWLTLALVAAGIAYSLILGAVRPRVLEQAPALLEGSEDPAAPDPLQIVG